MKCKFLLSLTLAATLALCAGPGIAETGGNPVLDHFSFDLTPQELADEMNAQYGNGAYVIADGYGVDSSEPVEVHGLTGRITASYFAYEKPVLGDLIVRYYECTLPLDTIDAEVIQEMQDEAVAIFASAVEGAMTAYGAPNGGLFTYLDDETGDTIYFDFPLSEDGKLETAVVMAACGDSDSLSFDLEFDNVQLTFAQQISPWDYQSTCTLHIMNPDVNHGRLFTTLQGAGGPYPLDP